MKMLRELLKYPRENYNGAHAGSGLVDCGGGSSCLLLLHPSSTCADAGPDVCTLCLCCFCQSTGANIYSIHIPTCANTA